MMGENDPFACFGEDSGSSSDDSERQALDSKATVNLEEARRLKSLANDNDAGRSIALTPITDDPRFEMFDSGPLSGKGLRATSGYKRGDEILRERAAMRVPNSHAAASLEEAREMHRWALQRAFDSMHRATRDALMELYSCDEEEGAKTPRGVYDTNSYQLWGAHDNRGGLFLTVARINHSCRPNVDHFWREDLQRTLVFATRDIEAGEELFTTYGPSSYMDTRGRREYLNERFSFKCMCSMCAEGNANGGDDRMAQIQSLQEDTAFFSLTKMAAKDASAALESVEKCLALMNEQGIGGPVFTKSLYHRGHDICMAAGDSEGAISYLGRELKAVQDSEGIDSPKAIKIESVLNGVRVH
ncbi:hypothetical protein ACHAWF_003381 [Thalassiosira exigua]